MTATTRFVSLRKSNCCCGCSPFFPFHKISTSRAMPPISCERKILIRQFSGCRFCFFGFQISWQLVRFPVPKSRTDLLFIFDQRIPLVKWSLWSVSPNDRSENKNLRMNECSKKKKIKIQTNHKSMVSRDQRNE